MSAALIENVELNTNFVRFVFTQQVCSEMILAFNMPFDYNHPLEMKNSK